MSTARSRTERSGAGRRRVSRGRWPVALAVGTWLALPVHAGDGLRMTERMALAVLAEQVSTQALARPDPLVLVMAARLKRLQGGSSSPGAPVDAGVAGRTAVKPGPHPRSAEALLARARALSIGRADLLALIDDVAQERPRGVEDGPRTRSGVAAPLATDTYREPFKAGEPAAVLIAGDGDSNLDLYVFDERGARICASERLDDVEVCRWQPRAAGRVMIHVVNRGRVDNRYELRSN